MPAPPPVAGDRALAPLPTPPQETRLSLPPVPTPPPVLAAPAAVAAHAVEDLPAPAPGVGSDPGVVDLPALVERRELPAFLPERWPGEDTEPDARALQLSRAATMQRGLLLVLAASLLGLAVIFILKVTNDRAQVRPSRASAVAIATARAVTPEVTTHRAALSEPSSPAQQAAAPQPTETATAQPEATAPVAQASPAPVTSPRATSTRVATKPRSTSTVARKPTTTTTATKPARSGAAKGGIIRDAPF